MLFTVVEQNPNLACFLNLSTPFLVWEEQPLNKKRNETCFYLGPIALGLLCSASGTELQQKRGKEFATISQSAVGQREAQLCPLQTHQSQRPFDMGRRHLGEWSCDRHRLAGKRLGRRPFARQLHPITAGRCDRKPTDHAFGLRLQGIDEH